MKYADVHIRYPGGYPGQWSIDRTRELFRQYFAGEVTAEYEPYIYMPGDDWEAKYAALHERFDKPDRPAYHYRHRQTAATATATTTTTTTTAMEL